MGVKWTKARKETHRKVMLKKWKDPEFLRNHRRGVRKAKREREKLKKIKKRPREKRRKKAIKRTKTTKQVLRAAGKKITITIRIE